MKIYITGKEYPEERWKVFEVEVEEKPNIFILKDCVAAFGYRRRMIKDEAHLTPSVAIAAGLNGQKRILKEVESHVVVAKNNIAQLENLRSGLKGGD